MQTDIETGIIELCGSTWKLKNYPIVEDASAEIPSQDFQMGISL